MKDIGPMHFSMSTGVVGNGGSLPWAREVHSRDFEAFLEVGLQAASHSYGF